MDDRPRRSLTSLHRIAKVAMVRRHKPDYWLLILTTLLMAIGLVVVYSISPGLSASQGISQSYFVIKQLIAVILGLVVFGLAAAVPSHIWQKLVKPLAVLTLAGCAMALVLPVNAAYPAHRWIRLGAFSFQIAELIKLTLIMWTAGFLAERWRAGKLADFNSTLKPLILVLLAIGVVVAKLQSDLGSAGVMAAIMGLSAFIVGVPMKRILAIGGLVLILVVLAVASSGYRRERLQTFLHPESNCLTTGYQECQALISVGSGGLFGLGLGNSVQAYGYQPEAANDSIFAIMGEKFGFVGSLCVLVVYGALITKLKRIIERTADQFDRVVVAGVLAWLSTQMIINIGAMLGLLPLKGITLPLISQGGTSLVFLTAALGVVFQISRYTSYSITEPERISETPTNHSPDGGRLGRTYNAALTTRPRT